MKEALFSSLKSEVADGFASCGEANMELFDYIDVFYDQRWRHSTLGQVSPAEFRKAHVHGAWIPGIWRLSAARLSSLQLRYRRYTTKGILFCKREHASPYLPVTG